MRAGNRIRDTDTSTDFCYQTRIYYSDLVSVSVSDSDSDADAVADADADAVAVAVADL